MPAVLKSSKQDFVFARTDHVSTQTEACLHSTERKSCFQNPDSKLGTREGMMKKPLKLCGMFKLQLGANLNPNQPKAAFMACVIFKPDCLSLSNILMLSNR